MSDRLSKFILRIEQLPDREQTMLAEYLHEHLDDVLDEARWQESFGRSGKLLHQMSLEVDDAIKHGAIAPLDPDEL